MALLLAECFALVHAVGYFLNVYHVLHPGRTSRISLDNIPELTSYPPVAVIVSAFKEPLDVLEDTLTCFYNLTYPNKRVYLLDDTRYGLPGEDPVKMAAYRKDIEAMCESIGVNLFRRRWRGAKAGMINDFLQYLDDAPPEGFECYPFQHHKGKEATKYVIVFDADMNALPDFVEPLVAFMEEHPELAFIQTPQYYTNFEDNRVARGGRAATSHILRVHLRRQEHPGRHVLLRHQRHLPPRGPHGRGRVRRVLGDRGLRHLAQVPRQGAGVPPT